MNEHGQPDHAGTGRRGPTPLTELETGQHFRVVSVGAGWGASRRLADLGLLAGTVGLVVRQSRPGPVLVEVRGSRLAIGHGLAAKVLVELNAEDGS